MTTSANARAASQSPGIIARLAAIEDGAIIRFAFFALLIGTASVLYLDFQELTDSQPVAGMPAFEPILPPVDPASGPAQSMPNVLTPPELLEAPLVIDLGPGGTLRLTGTIEPGSAARFAEELEARGEYVSTIALDSPGGSVIDALEIGALIRERALGTRVDDGSLCASSCPIIFAGGVARSAGDNAAIGVHQIYAASLGAAAVDAMAVAGVAMSDAQATTARITRYLIEGGVDAEVWLHALETPPNRLYYFSSDEMKRLNLVTPLNQT